jgi:DNA-binding YbaB/EbfC family protein
VFNFKELMQQAQGLQAKITALQEELAEKTVVGSAGGDMVKVEASGTQEIISLQIEEQVLSSGDAEMSKLTGGLRIPGLS